MSWGRLTMILATFVQKCKEKCVWSPGLPLTVSQGKCTVYRPWQFYVSVLSLLSTTLTTHSLWMNLNICIVQLIICWKIHIYYLRILTLGWNVLSLFGLVTVGVTRQTCFHQISVLMMMMLTPLTSLQSTEYRFTLYFTL